MDHGVAVALFETVEFLDVVQVSPTDDDGILHLIHGHTHAPRDLAANGNITGERALLVDVLSRLRFLGSSKAKTHVLVVTLDGSRLLSQQTLVTNEDGVLLLEGLLVLISHRSYSTTYD